MKIAVFYCLLFLMSKGICQTYDYKDVAVIVNTNSEISLSIGNHFKAVRNIPTQNMIFIDAPTSEIIDSIQFGLIKYQVENHLVNNNIKDSINYIVTTKGVPLKVNSGCVVDTISGMNCASFDSEIGLILGDYSSFIGQSGSIQNPYYSNNSHFSKATFGFYLVTRLDAYTLSDIIRLIDRSGPSTGVNKNSVKTIVDVSNGVDGDSIYFSDIFIPAYDFLSENSWNSILDLNFQALKEQTNVFLYLGVGHGPLPFQRLDYEFVNGSACVMDMCSSSFTFDFESKEPNDLLLADLIAEGCTAGYGNVDYVFFGNIMSPELFVNRYLNSTENYNLAESFYMAARTLSWQTVMIGDPKSSIVINNIAELFSDNNDLIQVFPNPIIDKIIVKSAENLFSVRIIDLNGKTIIDFSNLTSNEESLDLSTLKQGTYLIQVIGENKIFQKMILKIN